MADADAIAGGGGADETKPMDAGDSRDEGNDDGEDEDEDDYDPNEVEAAQLHLCETVPQCQTDGRTPQENHVPKWLAVRDRGGRRTSHAARPDRARRT